MDGQRIRNLIGIAVFGRSIRVNGDGIAADLDHSRIVAAERYEQIDRNIGAAVLDDRRSAERKRCAHANHALDRRVDYVAVIANAQVTLCFLSVEVDRLLCCVPLDGVAQRLCNRADRNHRAAIYGNRLQGRGLTLDNNLHLCLLTLCVRYRSNHHRLIVCRHSRSRHRACNRQCHHHRDRLFHK